MYDISASYKPNSGCIYTLFYYAVLTRSTHPILLSLLCFNLGEIHTMLNLLKWKISWLLSHSSHCITLTFCSFFGLNFFGLREIPHTLFLVPLQTQSFNLNGISILDDLHGISILDDLLKNSCIM